jgi:hypothetical protein
MAAIAVKNHNKDFAQFVKRLEKKEQIGESNGVCRDEEIDAGVL